MARATDKLLAEWFWTDRWMGSSAFLMPMEPRGLYREMLTQAWRRGARRPKDHEAIRRATGATEAEWERCWPKIRPYWTERGEYLVNETQAEVYAEAKSAQERASERGKKGAQARAQASAQAQPERQLKDKPPSPSPSPSPEPNAPPAGGATRAGAREAASTPADGLDAGPSEEDLIRAIPHDPNDDLHRRIVAKCITIAQREACSEGREATAEDVRSVFVAVSATPNGRSLDGLLDSRGRKSKRPWVEQTLVACDRFEADMDDPPSPWLYRAAKLWSDATGSPAPNRLEDVLRDLVRREGWDSLEADWAAYCARPSHELSPEHFVALRGPSAAPAPPAKRIPVVHPQPDAEQAWAKVLSLLDPENPLAQPRPGLKAESFRAWLRPLHGVRLEGKVVVAVAPTQAHADWAQNFARDLELACKAAGFAGFRLIVGALPAHLN